MIDRKKIPFISKSLQLRNSSIDLNLFEQLYKDFLNSKHMLENTLRDYKSHDKSIRPSKQEVMSLKERHRIISSKLQQLELSIPNEIHSSVQSKEYLVKEKFIDSRLQEARCHSLSPMIVKHNISKFSYITGQLSVLNRAIISYMLDTAVDYTQLNIPLVCNSRDLIGSGQFPKMIDAVYSLRDHDDYLVPTAETSILAYVSNKTLTLPEKYVAYSCCFRKEAGSYGKHNVGLIRQHQFEKVELFQVVNPDMGYSSLDILLDDCCKILDGLEIPYRVICLSAQDTPFASAKTYDIEVWLPSKRRYLEVSSVSWCRDFQSRRTRIKFLSKTGMKTFAHTLNGSALAVGRTLAAIMENFQINAKTIKIPVVLQKYINLETMDIF